MGLFEKRESMHFVRDEAGKVVDVERSNGNGNGGNGNWKSSKQLESEYRKTHPSRWDKYKERRVEERRVYDKAFSKAKEKAITRRAGRVASERFSATPMERVDRLLSGFTFSPPGGGNANPFGSRFDSGLGKPKVKHPKGKGKTQFAVVGGKAYPIAKSVGKKKKKGKSSSSSRGGGFDMMDNWGFMK